MRKMYFIKKEHKFLEIFNLKQLNTLEAIGVASYINCFPKHLPVSVFVVSQCAATKVPYHKEGNLKCDQEVADKHMGT